MAELPTEKQDRRFKDELAESHPDVALSSPPNEILPSKWTGYIAKLFKSRFGRKFLDILYETAVMFLYVGAIALLHKGLGRWMEKDAKLFDRLPISYIIDAGHSLAIGRFLLELGKSFLEGVKDFVSVFARSKDNSGKTD